jgi:murein DD-endopeptidase MepM/ murein hydrolase activator NlpD
MALRSALIAGVVAIGACAHAGPVDRIRAGAPDPAAIAPLVKPAVGEEVPDLAKRAAFAEAMREVESRQRVFQDASASVALDGSYVQGGLVFGKTSPGAKVALDAEPVMVGADGAFVLGFGRDHGQTALLVVVLPDGTTVRRALEIADRDFPVDRIDGLDQSKVSGFTEEQLAQIAADTAKKDAARRATDAAAHWSSGFAWPLVGRITGVFGSQRVLNGEAKTPHSGVDVAAPAGAPIKAPAPGIVRLAEPGLYFEGGLVLIDHGHWLESGFMHLSRIDVKVGDKVDQGQVIGAVGATGRATGPHMHWSLRWGAVPVDPALVAGEMPAADALAAGR